MLKADPQSAWPNEVITLSKEGLLNLRLVCDDQLRLDAGSAVVEELSRYLTVRSCGHLEVVSTQSVLEFAERNSFGPLANYICATYKTWMSPKASNLKSVLEKLSPVLSDSFIDYLRKGDRDYESDLGSLVSSRDKVAHGQNVQINMRKAMDYCDSVMYVADWYIESFKPSGLADSLQSPTRQISLNRSP